MFEAAFMRVALAASIAASVPLSVLGVYLIVRRMVFLGLVLANAATVGAAIGAGLCLVSRDHRCRRRPSDRAWSRRSSLIRDSSLASRSPRGRTRRPHQQPCSFWRERQRPMRIRSICFTATSSPSARVTRQVLGFLRWRSCTVHGVLQPRFLLITFDAEAAQVAGVNTRVWSICLNLSIGVAAAAAVHEIGTLVTFSLLTLPPMASLLVTRRIRSTFFVSAAIG